MRFSVLALRAVGAIAVTAVNALSLPHIPNHISNVPSDKSANCNRENYRDNHIISSLLLPKESDNRTDYQNHQDG